VLKQLILLPIILLEPIVRDHSHRLIILEFVGEEKFLCVGAGKRSPLLRLKQELCQLGLLLSVLLLYQALQDVSLQL
jgi:hypothetical protein